MTNDAPPFRRMLNTVEAAIYCGSSASTFEKLRLTGGGPLYSKIGRRVVYRIEDLDAWLAANRRHSTSDTGNGGPEVGRARLYVQGLSNAETACLRWLLVEMSEAKRKKLPRTETAEHWKLTAMEKFAGLSGRGFARAWARANAETGSGWDAAGRRRKTAR